MSQESRSEEMRPEYDIRGGVRGKYLHRYRQAAAAVVVVKFTGSVAIAEPSTVGSSIASITPESQEMIVPKIQMGALR
jgi:hypothetical protein